MRAIEQPVLNQPAEEAVAQKAGRWPQSKVFDVLMISAVIFLALALRVGLLQFESGDYFKYTKPWYDTLRAEGFSAFGHGFSNYNLPYLYLLYGAVLLFPDLPAVIAIKVPSLLADLVSAWLAFRIVGLKYRTRIIPFLAALAVLYAPTVVLNSALWGQADAVYACAVLAVLFLLARRRDGPAMLLYGVALSLKAQSLFVLPLIATLVLRKEIRWKSLLWIPVVALALVIPALAAGRLPLDILLIYPSQAGQYSQLVMHAPSFLAWMPDSGQYYRYFYPASLILAAAVVCTYCWAVYRSPARFHPALLIELALLSAILVPFFLPKMHERYFYLADILSLVFAFFMPSYFFVPLVMIGVSFFAYQPALFGTEPLPMSLLALGVFFVVAALLRHALPHLLTAPPHN